MDLEKTEARNDCAVEGQQQFNRSTDSRQLEQWVVRQLSACKNVSTEAEDIVGIRQKATTGEDMAHWEDLMCAV
jgi:hypothetical protein